MEGKHILLATSVVILLILVIEYAILRKRNKTRNDEKERFLAKENYEKVYKKSKNFFGGDHDYDSFKETFKEGDIVDYYNLKKLHRNNSLNKEEIKKVLT